MIREEIINKTPINITKMEKKVLFFNPIKGRIKNQIQHAVDKEFFDLAKNNVTLLGFFIYRLSKQPGGAHYQHKYKDQERKEVLVGA